MSNSQPINLRRDCDALEIPSGRVIILSKGIPVSIQQAMGGTYTVRAAGHLVRIAGRDADALGLITADAPRQKPRLSEVEDLPVDHDDIRRQLSSCYDPEIPVNILDLGLVYNCQIAHHPEGGSHLSVQMTLTAPGCGMGAILAAEVKEKLLTVRGVRSVDVKLVFDPPWDSSRMSEAAKLTLGLL